MALVAVATVAGQVQDQEGRAGRGKRCRRLHNLPTGFDSDICPIISCFHGSNPVVPWAKMNPFIVCVSVLGLFNVVQFENGACNATDDSRTGVCFTSSECEAKGGEPGGVCAAGFGVCCICKLEFLHCYFKQTILK